MIRRAAGAVVVLHGMIHLIGFAVAWQVASVEGFTYRTTVLNGLVDVGGLGARAIGVVWLACAVAFVVAGVGIWRGVPAALSFAAGLAVVSLGLCLLGVPETVAGLAVNIAILGAVAWGARAHSHAVVVAR